MKYPRQYFKAMLSLFACCLLFLLCSSDSLANPETPRAKAEAFFNLLISGKIDSAYDHLFQGSSIPANKPQAVTVLKQQTASGLPLYGKLLGVELIREERFGKSLTRLVYILQSEMAPTVWEFFFYKPQEKCFLVNIMFSDKYDLLDAKNN